MKLRIATATVVAAFLAGGAHAAPTTFFGEDTNGGGLATTHANADAARTDFFSHLIGVGTEGFEGYSSGTGTPLAVSFGAAGTASLSGSGSVQSTGNEIVGRFAVNGTKYYDTDGTFTITFSAPIAAFGFYGIDLGDIGAALTLTLTAADNSVSTLAVNNEISNDANGSVLYFGFFDSATTYKSISFAGAGGDVFGFDDFSIGSEQQVSVDPIPEPAMLGLFGLGALGLAASRRRRKA